MGNSFADVPTTYPFYSYIENLFHSGATGGCGGGPLLPAPVRSPALRWRSFY